MNDLKIKLAADQVFNSHNFRHFGKDAISNDLRDTLTAAIIAAIKTYDEQQHEEK